MTHTSKLDSIQSIRAQKYRNAEHRFCTTDKLKTKQTISTQRLYDAFESRTTNYLYVYLLLACLQQTQTIKLKIIRNGIGRRSTITYIPTAFTPLWWNFHNANQSQLQEIISFQVFGCWLNYDCGPVNHCCWLTLKVNNLKGKTYIAATFRIFQTSKKKYAKHFTLWKGNVEKSLNLYLYIRLFNVRVLHRRKCCLYVLIYKWDTTRKLLNKLMDII